MPCARVGPLNAPAWCSPCLPFVCLGRRGRDGFPRDPPLEALVPPASGAGLLWGSLDCTALLLLLGGTGGPGGGGKRAPVAGSCPQRAALPPPLSPTHAGASPCAPDRCGDLALSWAGPEPRQTEGQTFRANGTALLVVRAGPLASCPVPAHAPIRCWAVWCRVRREKRGQGRAESGPISSSRPLPGGVGGPGVPGRSGHPRRWPVGRVLAGGPLSRGREGRPPRRHAASPSPWSRRRVLLVPLRCSWSAPGRPSGARGRVVVSFPAPSKLSPARLAAAAGWSGVGRAVPCLGGVPANEGGSRR